LRSIGFFGAAASYLELCCNTLRLDGSALAIEQGKRYKAKIGESSNPEEKRCQPESLQSLLHVRR